VSRRAPVLPSQLLSQLLALLLSLILGAALALHPLPAAAAAAPTTREADAPSTAPLSPAPRSAGRSSVPPAATTTRPGARATGSLTGRGLGTGCPGPDALCDLAGDLSGCGLLDTVCDTMGLPGLPGLPSISGLLGLPGIAGLGNPIPGLGDILNPFQKLGDIVARAAADAWTASMLALWNAGLFVLRIVLAFCELFLVPDLGADGPGKDVYAYALWGALALVVIMALVQLGVAAFRREGRGVARALIGSGQFVIVCALWFGYCVSIVAACGAITRALMKALLGVDTWPAWDPLGGLDTQHIADGTVATVLGLLGLVLWLAAVAHLLIYLARAASLLVLVATGPLAAAGLVADAGRAWFWKSLRWFHAAAFTPVLMVLVLGIGVQMANGVAAHLADSTQRAIGTALPAVMLISISALAPLALFKLLAFVDPGTPSGASFRQGLAIQGGLQGLLGGSGAGSSAASTADAHGRSVGEQGAESSTGDRFGTSTQGLLGELGQAGQALATGLGLVQSAGAKGASLMSDESNQAGVGHHTYGPDFTNARSSTGNSGGPTASSRNGEQPPMPPPDHNDGDDPDPPPAPPTPPTPPTPPVPTSSAAGGRGPRPSGHSGQSGRGGQGAGPGAASKPPGGAGAAGGGVGAGTAGASPPPGL
jgi:type IV secretion system protein TrbL